MPRWMKMVRGMMVTGLIFAGGVGVVASVIAGIVWLLPGSNGGLEMFRVALASAIWAFPVGMAFAGFMALTARGRTFDKLSLLRFALLGAGGGLLLFGALALNAWQAWTAADALANLAIFLVLGSGSATAILLLARKGRPTLGSADDPRKLDKG